MTKDQKDNTSDKIQHSELNPAERPIIRRTYNPDLTSGLGAISEATRAVFEFDIFADVARPFRAIVLRDESQAVTIPIEAQGRINAILAKNNSDESAAANPRVKMVRCRIPELHFHLPEPEDYGDPNFQHLIDLYPLFVGLVDEESSLLIPGDIVEVDFGNLTNLSDPIFVRALKAATNSGGNRRNQDPSRTPGSKVKNRFDRSCSGNYNGKGAPGSPLKHVPNTALSNIGPQNPARYSPINPEKRRGQVPSGKGMFLLGYRRSANQGKEAILKRCKWAGLSFVCLMTAWQEKGHMKKIQKKRNREYGKFLSQNGIQVYLWGFPWATKESERDTLKREHEFAKYMCEEAVECGALGIITDPEAGYYMGAKRSGYSSLEVLKDQAVKHMQVLRQHADKNGGLSIGVTTYGTPNFHMKRFPFSSFAAKNSDGKTYHDFTIPQVYCSEGAAAHTYNSNKGLKKNLRRYKKAGYINIIPALGTYGKHWQFDPGGSSMKSPARMAMEAEYPKNALEGIEYGGMEDGTVMWWEWGLTDTHTSKWGSSQTRWDIVKSLGNKAAAASTEIAKSDNKARTEESHTARSKAPSQAKPSIPSGSAASPPPAPKYLTLKAAKKMVSLAQAEYEKAIQDNKKNPPPWEHETTLGRTELALQEAKKVLGKIKAGQKIVDSTNQTPKPASTASGASAPPCADGSGGQSHDAGDIGAPLPVDTDPNLQIVINKGKPFSKYGKKRRKKINMIVIHESVVGEKNEQARKDGGRAGTYRVLENRGLSIEYMVGKDGSVTQHIDPRTGFGYHGGGKSVPGGGVNSRSIGIEILNKWKSSRARPEEKDRVFGKYLNPTIEQQEACYRLIVFLVKTFPDLHMQFWNVRGDKFYWSKVDGMPKGVTSHSGYVAMKGDGSSTAYYCTLRARGYAQKEAYSLLGTALEQRWVKKKKITTLPPAKGRLFNLVGSSQPTTS